MSQAGVIDNLHFARAALERFPSRSTSSCSSPKNLREISGDMSLKELPYGSPAKQEISVEARHAPRSRFPHQRAARGRADDGRSPFASSHSPSPVLSRQEGRQDQERVGLQLAQ